MNETIDLLDFTFNYFGVQNRPVASYSLCNYCDKKYVHEDSDAKNKDKFCSEKCEILAYHGYTEYNEQNNWPEYDHLEVV